MSVCIYIYICLCLQHYTYWYAHTFTRNVRWSFCWHTVGMSAKATTNDNQPQRAPAAAVQATFNDARLSSVGFQMSMWLLALVCMGAFRSFRHQAVALTAEFIWSMAMAVPAESPSKFVAMTNRETQLFWGNYDIYGQIHRMEDPKKSSWWYWCAIQVVAAIKCYSLFRTLGNKIVVIYIDNRACLWSRYQYLPTLCGKSSPQTVHYCWCRTQDPSEKNAQVIQPISPVIRKISNDQRFEEPTAGDPLSHLSFLNCFFSLFVYDSNSEKRELFVYYCCYFHDD